MTCDDVRELLPDHVMGSLSEDDATAVRRHLRGCAACRADASRLDEGLGLFSVAAHAVEPPPELRERVLSTLAEEWGEAEASAAPGRPRRLGLTPVRMLAAAAVIVALAAVGWGVASQMRANEVRADALSYQRFLHSLGGRDVRVANLSAAAGGVVEGTAILYDSDRGQSWVLVVTRAPGMSGQVTPVLRARDGGSIRMHPITLDPGGDGSTWFLTAADISRFSSVQLVGVDGRVLASGVARQQES